MSKIYIEDIRSLGKMSFAVENVRLRRSSTTPYTRFKCEKGHLKKSRFFYVIEGVFIINLDKRDPIVAKAGEIVYLPSDVEYESEWAMGLNGAYITLECNLFTPEREELFLGENIFVICRDKTEKHLKNMIKMYECFSQGSTSSRLKIVSLIYSFLADIVEDAEKKKLRKDDIVSPIYRGIVYMNDNYRENISIKQVAELCNMSESTFRRRFLQHFEMSPHDYINSLKIQKAKELLDSGMYNVNEVADLLNFYDTSHFNKFFKRYCGTTPGKYISD